MKFLGYDTSLFKLWQINISRHKIYLNAFYPSKFSLPGVKLAYEFGDGVNAEIRNRLVIFQHEVERKKFHLMKKRC